MYFTGLSCGESVVLCFNLIALILLDRWICSKYVCIAFRKQPYLDTGNCWSLYISNLKLQVCVLLQVLRDSQEQMQRPLCPILFCCHLNPLSLLEPLFMWRLSAPPFCCCRHTCWAVSGSLAPCCFLILFWLRGVTWIYFLLCRIYIISPRKMPWLCSLNRYCYPLPQQTSQELLHSFAEVLL